MLSPPRADDTTSPPSSSRPRRAPSVILLRQVPGDSPVHRLWAGTKLLAVAGVSVVLSYYPSWGAVGLVFALLLGTGLVARIPAGALPRPPWWFWALTALTGGLASLSGGPPRLTVGGAVIALGGLDSYLRFVSVGVLLLLAGAMVGWTTPMGEVAPALARLLGPFRLLRLPVDEAAVAVALCVRSLPLLVGELRMLVAARKLRPHAPPRPGRTRLERWLDEVIDVLVAALAVSVRRAGELAEAITARGGTGLIAAKTVQPGTGDLVALAIVSAVCAGAALVPG